VLLGKWVRGVLLGKGIERSVTGERVRKVLECFREWWFSFCMEIMNGIQLCTFIPLLILYKVYLNVNL
jgi:hypothetical protein